MTLMEMLVVIALTSVVGIAISSSITYFYKSNAYLLEQTFALDNARRGITDAVASIREMSYGDDGSYPLAVAATSTITFYADLDNDGAIEKVRYYLQSEVLYRGTTNSSGYPPSYTGQPESTTTVAAYVRNSTSTPLFVYYDVSGNLLSSTSTDVSKVSSVGISLMVDLNPTRAPNVFTLYEQATLRNLRTQ
jgi:type II secretory pathway pseudopilin PulG